MSTIGIVGTAFCGSTLVSVILDGLPEVAAVGETHCIIDKDMTRMWNCRTCGNECEYLTDEFFDRLRNDPSDWWKKFRQQMNMPASRHGSDDAKREIKHIVASEKWFAIYDKLGLPDQALLIWRNPVSWCCSWLMHKAMNKRNDVTLGELNPTESDIRGAMSKWVNFYRNALLWIRKRRIGSVFLHFESFVVDTRYELGRLCTRFGIEYSSSAIYYTSMEHHHICGNGGVTISSPPAEGKKGRKYWEEHLKEIPHGKLSKDLRYKKAFSGKQIRMIENDLDVMKMFEALIYAS
jgi:hypothetical protein